MTGRVTEPLRILIVEDEAVVLMQLEALLEDVGHLVVGTAMSAEEAVPLIGELRPELVLLDVQLQDGSSGLEVARAVRDQEVTIVFITANARMLGHDLEGAAAVINKPFNEKALEGSIAYLEECVHRPPPTLSLPLGMRLAPAYMARLDNMRAPM